MEKSLKDLLQHQRSLYNKVEIPEYEVRKPLNLFFRRMDNDLERKISQCTGIEKYDQMFTLLTGKSLCSDKITKKYIEGLNVLFQLRNVIAHGREINAHQIRDAWSNEVSESFLGGYKRAEDYLIKKGILQQKFVKDANAGVFFSDPIADHFETLAFEFVNNVQIIVGRCLESPEFSTDIVNEYNERFGTHLTKLEVLQKSVLLDREFVAANNKEQ